MPCYASAVPPEEVEEDPVARLEALEREIEQRCREMIDRADSEANRMLVEAERAVTRRARVDAELLIQLSEKVVHLSESYRQALEIARNTVEEMAALLRTQGESPAGGPGEGPTPGD